MGVRHRAFAAGWQGVTRDEGEVQMEGDWLAPICAYCERGDPGFWAEPVNALSNGAFLVAAALATRARAPCPDGRCAGPPAQRPGGGGGGRLVPVPHPGGALVAARRRHPDRALHLRLLPAGDAALLRPRDRGGARRHPGLRGVQPRPGAGPRRAHGPVDGRADQRLDRLRPRDPGAGGRRRRPADAAGLRPRPGPRTRPGCGAPRGVAALFAVSLAFRTLDRAVCPVWPLGTHAVWHLLNAGVLYGLIAVAVRYRRHRS